MKLVALSATNRSKLTLTANEYAELSTAGFLYQADWLPDGERWPQPLSKGKVKNLLQVVTILEVHGAKFLSVKRLRRIATWLRGAVGVRISRV